MDDLVKKRPQDQTTEEWLADCEAANPLFAGEKKRPQELNGAAAIQRQPAAPLVSERTTKISERDEAGVHQFRFVGHRTTKLGSVALEFRSLDGRLTAVKFFNVHLKGRGGKPYPAGRSGQFNPPPRGTFREFWMQAVGKAPVRWCRIHKSLRSSLRDLVFVGTLERHIDREGQEYLKFSEISLKS